MDRAELIAYIGGLRKEQAEQAIRQGLTNWVLYAGTAAILFAAMPALGASDLSGGQLVELLRAYTYLQVLFTLASMVFSTANISPKNSTDYRFFSRPHGGFRVLALVVALQFAVPAATAFYVAAKLATDRPSQVIMLWDGWVLASVGSIGIAAYLACRLRNQAQPKLWLMKLNSPGTEIVGNVLSILLCWLFVANAYQFLRGPILHKSVTVSTLQIAFGTTVVAWLVMQLAQNGMRSSTGEILSRIERDFILYGTSEVEVIRRLEEEYIGRQLDAWLLSKLNDLRESAASLSTNAEELRVSIEGPSDFHTVGRKEKQMLLERYMNQLDRDFNNYCRSVETVLPWLERAVFYADRYIQQLIERAVQDVREVQREVRESNTKAHAALKSVLTNEANVPE